MRIIRNAQTAPSRNGDEITAVNSARKTEELRRLCKSLMEEAPAERPEFRKLLEGVGRRGFARIGAIKGLAAFSGTYGMDELWEGANALIGIIKGKKEAVDERFAAVDAIVAVMNSINSLREGGTRETVDSTGEELLQSALPNPGIDCSSDAMEDGIKAHKEKFGRMESVREDSLIVLLNSVSLAEIFDNKELSVKIKEAIRNMDSPYAKKISGSWRNSRPPEDCSGEREGVSKAGLSSRPPGEKVEIGELFGSEGDEEICETG